MYKIIEQLNALELEGVLTAFLFRDGWHITVYAVTADVIELIDDVRRYSVGSHREGDKVIFSMGEDEHPFIFE